MRWIKVLMTIPKGQGGDIIERDSRRERIWGKSIFVSCRYPFITRALKGID